MKRQWVKPRSAFLQLVLIICWISLHVESQPPSTANITDKGEQTFEQCVGENIFEMDKTELTKNPEKFFHKLVDGGQQEGQSCDANYVHTKQAMEAAYGWEKLSDNVKEGSIMVMQGLAAAIKCSDIKTICASGKKLTCQDGKCVPCEYVNKGEGENHVCSPVSSTGGGSTGQKPGTTGSKSDGNRTLNIFGFRFRHTFLEYCLLVNILILIQQSILRLFYRLFDRNQ